jgi:hypothetical protein
MTAAIASCDRLPAIYRKEKLQDRRLPARQIERSEKYLAT